MKRSKINVLNVVNVLQPGGLERVVLNLLDRSTDHGNAYVACLREAGLWSAQISSSRQWSGSECKGSFPRLVKGLVRCAREWNIDLIHSHNPAPHIYAVVAGRIIGVPVVHTKHGRNYPGHRRRVWLNRQLARCTGKIVAVSDDIANVAVNIEKVAPCKVCVIRNGIDVGKWRLAGGQERMQLRYQARLSDKAIVIGAVGRVSAEKRYDSLVRSFALLVGALEGMELVLVIVGDGPDMSAVRHAAAECGVLNRCIFAGMSDKVSDWLQVMDIFCLSSSTEGTSITLLEAGATGLPAVVTKVGGNGEVVKNGVTGIVAPAGDEQAFADALRGLCLDGDLRKQMGDAARERIAGLYSLESMMEKYEEVYAEVVQRYGHNIAG